MTSYDLQINQGATYSLTMNLTDSNGNPINLSTSIVSGFIRWQYSSSGILQDLGARIQAPASGGVITLNIPDYQTALLPIGVAVYNIKSFDTGALTTNWLMGGNVYIYPEATY